MPIQNGEYVAPQWTNNAPPPLNASELQAICDTVESNQDKYTKEENLSEDAKNALRFGSTKSVIFLNAHYTSGYGIYNNGMFLVCTDAGLFSSEDGATWTRKYVPAQVQENIIFANNRYTMIGNGYIYYTTDINAETGWKSISMPSGASMIYLILYANGMYMAAGGHSSKSSVIYSSDGLTWKVSQCPTSQQVLGIAYYDGYFYYTTLGNTYRTQNFTSWDDVSVGVPGKTICCALGHLYFISSNLDLYERVGNEWVDTGIDGIENMIGNDSFCVIITEDETDSMFYTTNFETYARYSVLTTLDDVRSVIYDNKNTLVVVLETKTNVNVITLADKPETPSDGFIAISNKINNIPDSIVGELASMIRSGVESTLV